MKLMDGKHVSALKKEVLKEKIATFVETYQERPHLCVIIIGENPASQTYVRSKVKMCEALGMNSTTLTFASDDIDEAGLIQTIEQLNQDPSIHGILVQLPLPKHIQEEKILNAIDPAKDVDGFHPLNSGLLFQGKPVLSPCTPSGIMTLLHHYNIPLEGKLAVVIGRSDIVGKPIAQLLLQANATVIMCHSRTKNLTTLTQQADLVIVAIGQPHFLKADMIKEGAVVIDVGINRLENGKLVGDVDFDSVKEKADYLTPVPGGVGPMTIIELMENTLICATQQKKIT